MVHFLLFTHGSYGVVLGGPSAPTAPAGFLFSHGALDFAGGTVVHINAAIAALVGAMVIGKRIGYGKEAMAPHNLALTMIGGSLLWVGWFGFNARTIWKPQEQQS